MNMHAMKLVTIVGEALARERVTRLLSEEGARGYTLFAVEGTGAKGSRVADIEEFTNIQIEVIVPEPVAQRLMERLQRDCFPHFAMIVFETDVRVLRQKKF
jgi:nitrogen regulatory protein PII